MTQHLAIAKEALEAIKKKLKTLNKNSNMGNRKFIEETV
jgi:hypothetical protein